MLGTMRIRLFTGALILFGHVACGGTTGEASSSSSRPQAIAGHDCPPGGSLTYDDFGGPFFSNYCTGCHSAELSPKNRQNAPIDVNFDTVEGIRSMLERIYARAAAGDPTMPPAGGPKSDERKDLAEWLACGAP